MPTALATINNALTDKGYTECPRDGLGRCLFTGHKGDGANHTKFAEQAGLTNGVYWCAVYTTAVLRRNGVPIAFGADTASTRSNMAAWQRAGRWVQPRDIIAGDIPFYHLSGRNGAAHNIPDHTGLALSAVVNRKLHAIEGNTSAGSSGSQDNGGGVFDRYRDLAVIIGAGRPEYEMAPPLPPQDEESDMDIVYDLTFDGPDQTQFVRVANTLRPVTGLQKQELLQMTPNAIKQETVYGQNAWAIIKGGLTMLPALPEIH